MTRLSPSYWVSLSDIGRTALREQALPILVRGYLNSLKTPITVVNFYNLHKKNDSIELQKQLNIFFDKKWIFYQKDPILSGGDFYVNKNDGTIVQIESTALDGLTELSELEKMLINFQATDHPTEKESALLSESEPLTTIQNESTLIVKAQTLKQQQMQHSNSLSDPFIQSQDFNLSESNEKNTKTINCTLFAGQNSNEEPLFLGSIAERMKKMNQKDKNKK